MNTYYHKKYLKYKNKYLMLGSNKSLNPKQKGGAPFVEVSSTFYYAQQNDVYYVMERIDNNSERLQFWNKFMVYERNKNRKYREEWNPIKFPKEKGYLPAKDGYNNLELTEGISSFEISLKNYHANNEFWVAFVSITLPDLLTLEFQNIEIYVTVMTTEDAPMISHFGISRSFGYMLRTIHDKNIILHPGMSLKLHAFSALIMTHRYSNKLYLITAPVANMAAMMIKKFPNDCFEGDSFLRSYKYLNNEIEVPRESIMIVERIRKNINDKKETEDELIAYIKTLLETRKLVSMPPMRNLLQSEFEDKKYENMLNFKYVNELSSEIPITIKDSPIRAIGKDPSKYSATRGGVELHIQILDKKRENIVFDHDILHDQMYVYNVPIIGNDKLKYMWFYHPHMWESPYLTISLDVLANSFNNSIQPDQQIQQINIIKQKQAFSEEKVLNQPEQNNLIYRNMMLQEENIKLQNKLNVIKNLVNDQ